MSNAGKQNERFAETTQFKTHIPSFYPLIIDILQRERAPEMRLAVRDYLSRVGRIYEFGY